MLVPFCFLHTQGGVTAQVLQAMADSQVTAQASAQAAAQATRIAAQVAINTDTGGQRVLAMNEFKVMD
jgi:hypothetical protein